MHVKIDIATKTFVRFVAVLGGFALTALLVVRLQKPLTLLFLSLFLALALNPPVSRLARLLPHQSRVAATALSYFVVVGLLGGFLVLVTPPIVQQSVSLVQSAPKLIDSLQDEKGPVRDFLVKYDLEKQYDSAIDNAKDRAASFAQSIGKGFVGGVGLVLNGVVALLTVLVLTFLMLIEGPAWLSRIWQLYEDKEKQQRHEALLKRMYRVVTGYVNGQVLIAAIAASCVLVVLLLFGAFFDVSYGVALPLAGVIFLASMIPMVGASIGAVVVAVVLAFNSITAALIFLVYYIIYQQIENNFIQPIVQARTVELTALTVISSFLIGATLFGFLGALVAIPVAGCLRVLIIHTIEHRQRKASIKPENAIFKVQQALGLKKKRA